MKNTWIYVIIAVAVCLTIGFLASYATQTSVNTWYATLNKPGFNPPNSLFAPVWTLLYILMGIAAGWVWSKGFQRKWVKTGLYFFGFQLLLNASWSIVFFGFRSPFWALWVILALLIMIPLTIKYFWRVSRLAAYLMVPYLLWVCFATALNYAIWSLN